MPASPAASLTLDYPIMANDWLTFSECPMSTRRWRLLTDVKIEIEGAAGVSYAWPKLVNGWRPLIEEASEEFEIPAAWIAAIMAIESGGRPDVCYRPGGKGSPCSLDDGAGLMAMLQSTAAGLAGRPVTLQELMDNPTLAIALGAMFIKHLSDKYEGDYLHVAVAYNAGSVRCAPADRSGLTVQRPREPCPPTDWGLIMGCVRTTGSHPICVPSKVEPGKNVCPNMYPDRAVLALNAAIDNGFASAPGPPPEPEPPRPGVFIAGMGVKHLGGFLLGAAAGFMIITAFYKTGR